MPSNLTVSKIFNDTASQIDITDFSVDIVRKEIHVGFDYKNADGDVIKDYTVTIDEPYFTQTIAHANSVVTDNVYTAIKSALYFGIGLKDPELLGTEV